MRRLVCFDVDGTLVDTASLNREAYARVGVLMPDGAWGLPWREWLVDALHGDENAAQRVHHKKTELYARMLVETPPPLLTAGLAAASLLRRGFAVQALTAGSTATAILLLERHDLDVYVLGNLTYEMCRAALAYRSTSEQHVTYVDDRRETIDSLRRDLPDVHVIHYVGQSASELCSLIETWGDE